MKYKRILLKLSGESLQGTQKYGLSPEVLQSYAEQIKAAAATGVPIGIVIGGANIFPGLSRAPKSFDPAKGDQVAPPRGIGRDGPSRTVHDAGQLRHGGVVGQHGDAPPGQQREIAGRVGHADQHGGAGRDIERRQHTTDQKQSFHKAGIMIQR